MWMWCLPVSGSPRLTFESHFTMKSLPTVSPSAGDVMLTPGESLPLLLPPAELWSPQPANSPAVRTATAPPANALRPYPVISFLLRILLGGSTRRGREWDSSGPRESREGPGTYHRCGGALRRVVV